MNPFPFQNTNLDSRRGGPAEEGLLDEPLVEPHPSPSLTKKFRRRSGMQPPLTSYVAPHPWLYVPFLFLSAPSLETIDMDLASAIGFVVARDNACRCCYGSFWASLRMAGYSEADLDRLDRSMYLRDDGHDEQMVLRFAVRVSRGQFTFTGGDSVAPLQRKGIGERAIREVTGIAVLSTFVNRVSTLLAIPAHRRLENVTSRWYFDLVRPIVSPVLRGWQKLSPEPPRLRRIHVEGPLANWTGSLLGTTVGFVVQYLANEWLHGTYALSLRVRLLMLAVVARGLGCGGLESTAKALVEDRSDFSQGEVEHAVNHLGGTVLPEAKAQLLELARASIRYDVDHIQRAARRHTKGLSRDETIDAAATIGFTNMIGRLQVLFQLDESDVA